MTIIGKKDCAAFSFCFCFKAKGPCSAPLAHLPSYLVLPYTTINVTSLKGCRPHPNPAGSATLAP